MAENFSSIGQRIQLVDAGADAPTSDRGVPGFSNPSVVGFCEARAVRSFLACGAATCGVFSAKIQRGSWPKTARVRCSHLLAFDIFSEDRALIAPNGDSYQILVAKRQDGAVSVRHLAPMASS
jgi:hypothetical protein